LRELTSRKKRAAMNSTTSSVISTVVAATKSTEFFFNGTMPIPPSVNMAYTIIQTKDGIRVGPTPALKRFKDDAILMLSQAYHDWSMINAIREAKRKVPLHVVLRVYFPTEWKRDLDGIIKYAVDAAFDRIQLNDNLIIKLEAEKHVDPVQPRIEIEISRICIVP
jgi:Holliday junction resolvase RusA-like endonuclease